MVANPFRVFLHWAWRSMLQRAGGQGLLVMLLLQLILFLVAAGLGGVVGGLDGAQPSLFALIFIAIVSGRFIGQRKRWWLWCAGFSAAALPLVFLVMGDLLPDLFRLTGLLLRSIGALVRHVSQGLPVGSFSTGDEISAAWLRFLQDVWVYADNVRRWLSGLLAGSPAFQADAVGFVWALLVYAAAFWAALWMRRTGHVLMALLPAGLVLSMPQAYTRAEQTGSLVLFLLGVLLLHALDTQHDNEQRWVRLNLDHPEDMRLDYSLAAMMFVGAIMVFTLVASQLNFRSMFNGLLGLERPEGSAIAKEAETIGELLGLAQPTPRPPYLDAYRAGGLPRSHLLGLPPEQQQREVMRIRVSGPGLPVATRYYWRSFAYDIYTGVGWQAGETERLRFARGDQVPGLEQKFAVTIRQEVMKLQPIGQQVYAAGEVVSVDRPFEIAWWSRNEGRFDIFGVRTEENDYTVDSVYPLLKASLLHSSGTDYPEWIVSRYLALPEDFSPDVAELAADWTRGMDSAYQKAQALEHHLRLFPYSLDVSLPPPGVDIAEYFLFDLQRGYCDYYATAMVVMARSVGLPARFAVGYAQGHFDPSLGAYIVSAENAHSWPEIYFPDFGWVPFEPTAGQADLERTGEALLPELDRDGLPPLVDRSGGVVRALRWTAVIFLFAAALVLGGWWLADRWRMARQSPQVFYESVLQQLFAYSHVCDLQLSGRATPAELTSAMRDYLRDRLAHTTWWGRMPGSVGDLDVIRDRIHQGIYSPRPLTPADKAEGLKLWRPLRIKIWCLVWIDRIDRILERLKW